MAIEADIISTSTIGAFNSGIYAESFQVGGADVDMVGLPLEGGRSYEIDVDNGGDFMLRVFDGCGTELKANDDGADFGELAGLSPYTQFKPAVSGVYYVAVSPYYLAGYDALSIVNRIAPANPLANSVGTLTVTDRGSDPFPDANSIGSVTLKGALDHSDKIGDADRRIRVEYEASGLIAPGFDVEMGRFDLLKGDTILVDVNGEVDAADFLDSVLRVFNSAGGQLAFDNGSGINEDSELTFVASTTGAYYITVSGEGNEFYDALTGLGTVLGDTGAFQAIIHRNPTLFGSSLVGDTLQGTGGADYIVGMAGDDTLSGVTGNDTLSGGDGTDVLIGGEGCDYLFGDSGNDDLSGGNGDDRLSGGLGDDTLTGSAGWDTIEGDEGNDTIYGGNDDDVVRGGQGDDVIVGAQGNDALDGGAGNDRLNGGMGTDVIVGGAGDDAVLGGDGNDTITGGDGADTLNGDNQDDLVDGGLGNDVLAGGAGDDALIGNAGDDTLQGNAGQDRLSGGQGIDMLKGGLDADLFDFDSTAAGVGIDIIQDFVAGSDRIDLSTIFAATGAVVTAATFGQFVQCTPAASGTSSLLAVDANGPIGGLSFTVIAQVDNVTAAALADIGNFIL